MLTWLELPEQISGMSQSFTASLHTIPLNSICSSTQDKLNRKRFCVSFHVRQKKQKVKRFLPS